MNTFVTILTLSCVLISVIESTPINDAASNPKLKHHRARFRPFIFQKATDIRYGRSIKESIFIYKNNDIYYLEI